MRRSRQNAELAVCAEALEPSVPFEMAIGPQPTGLLIG
jgi:hypothetical protein